MNKFGFLLIIFMALAGGMVYVIRLAFVDYNIPAIVFLSVVGALALVGVGHALSQHSTRNTSNVLRQALYDNMIENQSVINGQVKTINAINQNALVRAANRQPEITVEPPQGGFPMFQIDDTAFDALEDNDDRPRLKA